MWKIVALALAALVAPALSASIFDPNECHDYPCLIFEDNFDYLDLNVWEHEITTGGGGNGEFEVYVNNRTVSYVKNSSLFIKPDLVTRWQGDDFLSSGTLDLWGMNGLNDVCTSNLYDGCKQTGSEDYILSPIMSARMRTNKVFSVGYGKVEVRARMPRGDWIWPAIWMLPHGFHYGGWPASGEIDIVGSRGNDDYGTLGNMYGATTLHWGPYIAANRFDLTHEEYQSATGKSFADLFHTWTLEWTDDHLRVLLNNEEVIYVDPGTNFYDFGEFSTIEADNPWEGRGKMAPFDQPFYLMMNVAVGGTGGFFPDEVPANPPKPWKNTSPTAKKDFWEDRDTWYPSWQDEGVTDRSGESAAMEVDYIRVWKME